MREVVEIGVRVERTERVGEEGEGEGEHVGEVEEVGLEEGEEEVRKEKMMALVRIS